MIGAAEASRLGVDSLEHTVALLQKSLDYEDSISMTGIGYYRRFILWPSVNEEKLDAIFQVLVENGTAVVPTLAIQEVLADTERLVERSSDWFDLYQPEIYQSFLEDPLRVPDVFDFSPFRDQLRESILVQARQMARFVHMGGKVGTGSDLSPSPPLVPGLATHQEMEYFVGGGYDAAGSAASCDDRFSGDPRMARAVRLNRGGKTGRHCRDRRQSSRRHHGGLQHRHRAQGRTRLSYRRSQKRAEARTHGDQRRSEPLTLRPEGPGLKGHAPAQSSAIRPVTNSDLRG